MHSSPAFELLLTVEMQAFTVKLLSLNLGKIYWQNFWAKFERVF